MDTNDTNAMATMMQMKQQQEDEEKKQKAEQEMNIQDQPPASDISSEVSRSSIEVDRPVEGLRPSRSSKLLNRGSKVAPSDSKLVRPTSSSPFKWGDEMDEDEASKIQRRSNRSKGLLGSLPFSLAQLFKIIFFSSPAIAIILVIFLLYPPQGDEVYELFQRHEGKLNWKMETTRYALYYIGTVALYLISPVIFANMIFILQIIPKLLPGKFFKKVVSLLDYFLGTKSYWGFFLFTIAFYFLTINLMVDNNPAQWRDPATGKYYDELSHPLLSEFSSSSKGKETSTKDESFLPAGTKISDLVRTISDGKIVLLHRLTKCLVVFAFFIAVEKTFIQAIGVHFHKNAFADRIFEYKLRKAYFDDLYFISQSQPTQPSGSLFTKGNKSSYDIEAGLDLKVIDLTTVEKQKKKKTLADLNSQSSGFDDTSLEALEAIVKAKSIYNFFSKSKNGEDAQETNITVEAFRPYFSEDSYKDVFFLFDIDGTEIISKANFKSVALSLVKEEQDIKTSLKDHGQIVRKLDAILASIVSCIALVVSLSFFQQTISVYLASIGTFMLGFTFVFGGFAKNIFEDLVFLFVTHPYDVGDEIMLNGEQCTVINVDLLMSSFRRWDGLVIYASTQSLINKDILNIKRSGPQSISLEITIVSSTTADKVATFKKNLAEVLKSHRADFTGKVILGGFDVDGDKMRLRLTIEHKTNFHDYEVRVTRAGKMKLILREVLTSEGIQFYNL